MFGFGRCKACDAKDSEIGHLLGQLEKLNAMLERSQSRLIETAAPGAAARVAWAESRERERGVSAAVPAKPAEPEENFPGYLPQAPQVGYEVDES
jgi:hypothetical protein